MKKVTILLAVVVMVTMVVPSDAVASKRFGSSTTAPGSDDWSDGDNWWEQSDNTWGNVPAATELAYLRYGYDAKIYSGTTAVCDQLWMMIDGGDLEVATGGSLTVGNGSTDHITVGYTGTSTLNQWGGDVSVAGGGYLRLGEAGGTGIYEITGGALTAHGIWMESATSEFRVVGDVGTVDTVKNMTMVAGATGSTLKLVLSDIGSHITKLDLGSGTTDLDGVLVVDDTGYTKVKHEVIDILTVNGNVHGDGVLIYSSLTFGNTNWDLSHTDVQVNVGTEANPLWRNSTTLHMTCNVPEPATMVLLGLGGIGVLIRRRRK